MSVEREVFEQIDFDYIINQFTTVKEKSLKRSAEPKIFYPNNQKMPLVSDFKVCSCHFGHGEFSRIYSYKSLKFEIIRMKLVVFVLLLLYLLKYNSPLFRALNYDAQCLVQYAQTYVHVLKFMYAYNMALVHDPCSKRV